METRRYQPAAAGWVSRGLRARRALVAITAFAIVGGAAWGDLEAQEMPDRIRSAYPGDAARIVAVIDEFGEAGVPVKPLYDKALEGAAKRVPAGRLIPALREYAGRMQTARDLMGGSDRVAWVVAGADALRRGVDPEALTRVTTEGDDRTPVALVVMGDLMEGGVAGDRALDIVREAMQRAGGEDAVLDVSRTLRRLVREGAVPRDAVQDMLRALRDGTPLRRVRHRPGSRPGGLDHLRARPVPPGSDPTRKGAPAARHPPMGPAVIGAA